MTRFTSLSQLAHCSPYVRAQLEKHVDALPKVDTDGQPKKREHPEQDEGKAIIEWIDLLVLPNGLKPGEFFYHVPNGGARSKIEAGILKGQGVRPGWPDYGLDLPAGCYHGLRGELKAPNAPAPGEDQLKVLSRLESVGYKVHVWWSFEDAKRDIEAYLRLIG